MSNKIIDFVKIHDKQSKLQPKEIDKKPGWTPEQIEAKIKPYIEYLNKTPKKFLSKSSEKWTEEENEEFKRLVIKYTVECYTRKDMAEEIHKYFPWRTETSILGKISYVNQKNFKEIDDFYGKINYGGVVIRDAEMHYNSITHKIDFGNYLQLRMLQMVGLIPSPEEDESDETLKQLNEIYKKNNKLKNAALIIFDLNKKKEKNMIYEEAEEMLFATADEIKKITTSLNIIKITTKNLLDVAKKLDSDLGEMVRGLEPIFEDKEKTKQWKRAEKWREKQAKSLELILENKNL